MSLDFALFPAPKDSYSQQEELLGTLVFIPKLTGIYPYNTDSLFLAQHKLVQFVQIESKSARDSLVFDYDELPQKQIPQKAEQFLNFDRFKDLGDLKSSKQQQIENNYYVPQSERSNLQPLTRRTTLRDSSLPPKLKLPPIKDIKSPSFIKDNIPCLYIKANILQPNIILYFHGNACNIKQASMHVYKMVHQLQVSALLVEYPGYGMYPGTKNTGQTIKDDAQYVYQYLIRRLGYKEPNILVFGRSIGTGPAIHVASKYNPACLILMSPFTSIRDVVGHLVFRLFAHFINERFDNLQTIQKVRGPIYILHGKKDNLIPYSHSQKLIENANKSSHKWLQLADNMNHEHYNFMNDLIRPLARFLFDIGFKFEGGQEPEMLNQFQQF